MNRLAIFIATAARVRRTSVCAEGHRFHLVHAAKEHIHGPDISPESLGGPLLSGPARTIVDGLCSPQCLGGAIYVADALKTYRFSSRWDEEHFAEVLRTVGTGAAHKRLGMLLDEKEIVTEGLLRQAIDGRTSGVVDLDPGSPPRGRIISFWGVRRNVDLAGFDLPDGDDVEEDYIEGVDDPDP